MIAKYEVGSDPENFAIDKLAAKLFTANGLSDDVSVIDTATNKK